MKTTKLWLGLILLSFGAQHVDCWKKPIFDLPPLSNRRRSGIGEQSSIQGSILSYDLNIAEVLKHAVSNCSHLKSLEVRGGAQEYDEYDVEEEEDSDEDIAPIVSKVFSLFSAIADTISSIINQIFASPNDTDLSDDAQTTFKDFGSYLSHAYGCSDEDEDYEDEDEDDDDNKKSTRVEGGSISNALQKARSNARLLVVYIPASKPKKNKHKKMTFDQTAISSIRSSIVKAAADKRSKKKEKYGSFMFWSTKYDSSEASNAMKRLKVKPMKKSKSSPLLVVVYASQTFDRSGNPKIVPKVLAQHHCNPPPSAKSLSSWLNSLRKRHGKQFTAMQTELREMAFMKERNEGYHSSVKQDRERVEKERRDKEKKLEKERLRKEKEEALKERRKTLLHGLPEEPESTDSGIITIALRFGDGRTGQRRFSSETEIENVFNWVDAMFEIEREIVVLTTMNGQKSISFDDTQDGETLESAGLGRLVAFRVSVKDADNEDEANDAKSNDDVEEEYDEEQES